MNPFVHPSAYVHPTAVIYASVHIMENCYIGPYCIIGAPPEHPKHDPREFTGKGVYIQSGCILHGHNTVDSGIEEITFLHPNVTMMKHAHVGHDAIIGSQVTLSCGAKIGGHSVLKRYCNIGLNAVVHQFSNMAEGTMLGASGFYKGHHEMPFRIYAGVPAKDIGENKIGRERWEK